MTGEVRVMIDTDVGDDIDDALAILFALKLPEAQVEALSTVYGDVEVRGRLASKLLSAFKVDIPVALGSSYTLLGFKPRFKPCQAEVLEGEPGEYRSIVECRGYDLIASKAVEEGVRIVSIGPMTNLALAFLRNPVLGSKIKLTSMAGCIWGQRAEYNVRCDPEAAFLSTARLKPTLVTLDETLKCRMPVGLAEKIRLSFKPELRLISAMLDSWMKATGRRQPILHDPLAVAVAVKPSLARFKPIKVKIELSGVWTRGYTVPCRDGFEVDLCVDVDVEAFLQLFAETILS